MSLGVLPRASAKFTVTTARVALWYEVLLHAVSSAAAVRALATSIQPCTKVALVCRPENQWRCGMTYMLHGNLKFCLHVTWMARSQIARASIAIRHRTHACAHVADLNQCMASCTCRHREPLQFHLAAPFIAQHGAGNPQQVRAPFFRSPRRHPSCCLRGKSTSPPLLLSARISTPVGNSKASNRAACMPHTLYCPRMFGNVQSKHLFNWCVVIDPSIRPGIAYCIAHVHSLDATCKRFTQFTGANIRSCADSHPMLKNFHAACCRYSYV